MIRPHKLNNVVLASRKSLTVLSCQDWDGRVTPASHGPHPVTQVRSSLLQELLRSVTSDNMHLFTTCQSKPLNTVTLKLQQPFHKPILLGEHPRMDFGGCFSLQWRAKATQTTTVHNNQDLGELMFLFRRHHELRFRALKKKPQTLN